MTSNRSGCETLVSGAYGFAVGSPACQERADELDPVVVPGCQQAAARRLRAGIKGALDIVVQPVDGLLAGGRVRDALSLELDKTVREPAELGVDVRKALVQHRQVRVSLEEDLIQFLQPVIDGARGLDERLLVLRKVLPGRGERRFLRVGLARIKSKARPHGLGISAHGHCLLEHAAERVAELPDILDGRQRLHEDILVVRELLRDVLSQGLQVRDQLVQVRLGIQEICPLLDQHPCLRPEEDAVDRREWLGHGSAPAIRLVLVESDVHRDVAENGLLLLGENQSGKGRLLVRELCKLELCLLKACVKRVLGRGELVGHVLGLCDQVIVLRVPPRAAVKAVAAHAEPEAPVEHGDSQDVYGKTPDRVDEEAGGDDETAFKPGLGGEQAPQGSSPSGPPMRTLRGWSWARSTRTCPVMETDPETIPRSMPAPTVACTMKPGSPTNISPCAMLMPSTFTCMLPSMPQTPGIEVEVQVTRAAHQGARPGWGSPSPP